MNTLLNMNVTLAGTLAQTDRLLLYSHWVFLAFLLFLAGGVLWIIHQAREEMRLARDPLTPEERARENALTARDAARRKAAAGQDHDPVTGAAPMADWLEHRRGRRAEIAAAHPKPAEHPLWPALKRLIDSRDADFLPVFLERHLPRKQIMIRGPELTLVRVDARGEGPRIEGVAALPPRVVAEELSAALLGTPARGLLAPEERPLLWRFGPDGVLGLTFRDCALSVPLLTENQNGDPAAEDARWP